MLAKHAVILRLVYEICNEMKFYNLTTPLPAVGGIHDMFKANRNLINYETLKYTKGYIGVRVTNVQHYKEIVKNQHELQYLVQEIPPPWGIKL